MKCIILELDDLDERAVNQAITHLQQLEAASGCGLPDADGGNLAGRCVAEACRGYLDMLGLWKSELNAGDEID